MEIVVVGAMYLSMQLSCRIFTNNHRFIIGRKNLTLSPIPDNCTINWTHLAGQTFRLNA